MSSRATANGSRFGLREWLVEVPPNASAAGYEQYNVPHQEYLRQWVEKRVLLFAGPRLAAHEEDRKDLKVSGSVLLFRAPTREDVEAVLRGDPYAEAGIWHVSGITITPSWCIIEPKLSQRA